MARQQLVVCNGTVYLVSPAGPWAPMQIWNASDQDHSSRFRLSAGGTPLAGDFIASLNEAINLPPGGVDGRPTYANVPQTGLLWPGLMVSV
jgi:hypothetical protein